MTTTQWEAVGRDWSGGDHQRWWRAHTDAQNLALLDAWLPPSSQRLLLTDLFDETAGTGSYPLLTDRADTVVGIDVARSTAMAARARYPQLRSAVADVRHQCWPDGSFDAVVSLSTLDHFDDSVDLEDALAELRRLLTPGGTLVITLDNAGHPVVGLRNRLSPKITARLGLVPYPVGITFASPTELSDALGRHGLEVTEVRSTIFAPRVLAVAAGRALEARVTTANSAWERGYHRSLDAFERLGHRGGWWRTGHFLAALARRR